jgi:TonB family protein
MKRPLMPSHRVLCVVLLSACASTGTLGIDPQSSSHARVELVTPAAEDQTQVVPQAIDPQLPSADRLAHVIDARLGERASLDVRLCVTPAGRVASATLERSSTMPAFDQAVMSDIAGWQFASQPGPETLRTCETATVVYRPHR